MDRAFNPLQACRPLDKFFRFTARHSDSVQIAVLFNTETENRFAGFCDTFDNLVRPFLFNADDNDSRHVRIASRTDQSTEMQFQIFPELKTPVRVDNRQRSCDIVRNRLTSGV